MLKNLYTKVGIGLPKIEIIYDKNSYIPNEKVTGYIIINDSHISIDVKDIQIEIWHTYYVSAVKLDVPIEINIPTSIQKEQELKIPFSYQLPLNMPIDTLFGGTEMRVKIISNTIMKVKTSRDIIVKPTSIMEQFFGIMNEMEYLEDVLSGIYSKNNHNNVPNSTNYIQYLDFENMKVEEGRNNLVHFIFIDSDLKTDVYIASSKEYLKCFEGIYPKHLSINKGEYINAEEMKVVLNDMIYEKIDN